MIPIQKNPLITRQDLIDATNQLIEPLKKHYSKSNTQIQLLATGAAYSRKTIGIEGFSRVLWGLAPLFAGGGSSQLLEKHREGLINGTNPKHPDYWGDVGDFDQIIVEMAAIGYSLALAPEYFWDPLNADQKHQLATWLKQINHVKAHDCNWLFFAVIVNLGLKQVGEAFDQQLVERHLNRIEDFYLGEGWYKDGEVAHVDYYGPFAIHFYSLIYAKFMETEDPKRAKVYKERAKLFAKDFVYWFSENGQALPYGRSLTYRFSQVAFFAAYVFAEVEPEANGWIKGIILRHFRYWFKQPIFNGDQTLTVGYLYPNLFMSENYNSPCSPYWALKSMLILALPDQHSFWQVEEQMLPTLELSHVNQTIEKTIIRDSESQHVVLFPSGYKHTNAHTHTAAKYEKFAYSSHFGFSVPRSEWSLEQGAYDSMLAVSEKDDYYRVKRTVIEKSYQADYLYMKWSPWNDVEIESWVIPGLPWHVRVHRIRTARGLNFADGGYALSTTHSQVDRKIIREDDNICAYFNSGVVGALRLLGDAKPIELYPNSNTNMMATNTIIPTLKGKLEPGIHLVGHAFYGQPNQTLDVEQYRATLPKLNSFKENQLAVQLNGQVTYLTLTSNI